MGLLRSMAHVVTAYHAQIDMLLGNRKEGSVKDCNASPRMKALYEDAPNGPSAWDTGETDGTESEPVIPVTSINS